MVGVGPHRFGSVGIRFGKVEAWDTNAFAIRVTSSWYISGGHATVRVVRGRHASVIGLRLGSGRWRGWYLEGGGRDLSMQFRIVGGMLGIRGRWRWNRISGARIVSSSPISLPGSLGSRRRSGRWPGRWRYYDPAGGRRGARISGRRRRDVHHRIHM